MDEDAAIQLSERLSDGPLRRATLYMYFTEACAPAGPECHLKSVNYEFNEMVSCGLKTDLRRVLKMYYPGVGFYVLNKVSQLSMSQKMAKAAKRLDKHMKANRIAWYS